MDPTQAPPEASAPAAFLLDGATLQEYRVRAIYQELILLCVHHGIHRWWDCLGPYSFFEFNAIPMLRGLLREVLLHRAGDVRNFLRLTRILDANGGIPSEKDLFIEHLAETYAESLRTLQASVRPLPGGKRPFLLACPVWGPAFLERFQTGCLPSLLAEGNLPTLCRERAPVLLIHTDPEGEATLSASPLLAKMRDLGVEVRFLRLEPRLVAGTTLDPNFKYWHLAMIQSIELFYAKALGADYHITLPDVVYSSDYFRSLLAAARDHRSILQVCFRTDAETMDASLQAYRSGGALAVRPEALMAMALNGLHASSRPIYMNDRPSPEAWPPFHYLIWEGENALHLMSPHHTIAYLDRGLIQDLPERFYFTLDSELDKLLPHGEQPYFPHRKDGLVLIEVSSGEVEGGPEAQLDPEAYSELFWHRVESPRHLDFFKGDLEYPVDPALRTARRPMAEAKIREEMDQARRIVQGGRAPSTAEAMMNGLLCLHGAETHGEAQDLVPALRREAHAIWLCGRRAVTQASRANLMRQVLRMLCHFDLLEDAREALALHAPGSALDLALGDWFTLRAVNALAAEKLEGSWPKGGVPTVIGMTVWGASYLAFLLEYHLPALFAEGNLPSLARRGKVLYSIVTDAQGRDLIQAAPAFATLKTFAECHFTVVDPLPERVTRDGQQTFYRRLGLLDHHHVYLAKALRAALVLLPPDTVLSRGGLLALATGLEEGADACTTAGMEGDFQAVQPSLEAHKHGDVLAIGARDLIALAFRHRTPYFQSLFLTPGNRLNAYPREFLWHHPRGLICHSIFMHPLILSARVMARDFHPNHENVDWALLPRVLWGGAKIALLDADAGLFLMHCSNESEKPTEYAPIQDQADPALGRYLLSIHRHDFPIHRDLVRRPQFFPLEGAGLPGEGAYAEASARLLAMFGNSTFRCGSCF